MNVNRFFTKKKIIWAIIILVVVALVWSLMSKSNNKTANIQTAIASRQDLKQTVLTTGQVVSQTDLALSFQTSGVVKNINAVEGGKVKSGDVLAILDQSNAQAALVSASGALAQARANYDRVITGSTKEQIDVSQKAVNSAQVAYNNSLSQLENVKQSTAAAISQAQTTLDDLKSPTTQSDNKRSAIVVTIANQLSAAKSALDMENKILNDENLKNTFSVSDLTILTSLKSSYQTALPPLATANADLSTAQSYRSDININQAINSSILALNQILISLNYCFSALQNSVVSSSFSQAQMDAYKSSISGYTTTLNSGVTTIQSAQQALTTALTAAQNAVTNTTLSASQQITVAQNQINSAEAALQQAQANLNQQLAKPKSSDINSAQAQILSAQGQVDAAQAVFNNTILKAPIDGTITAVDIKLGELASAMKEVMVIQDINNLHAETYVSESNVANLQIGQSVDYTFDALGPDRHFNGQVLTINPASTIISGVVDYLVKASLPNIPEIKPGMTANMTTLVASKNNVLAIPVGAIINSNGQQSVRVVDDLKKKTYHQITVQVGLQADGGLVEITGGLSDGQTVVTYLKP